MIPFISVDPKFRKINFDDRKEYIDEQKGPKPILHLFGNTIFFHIHARAERSPERKLQAKVDVKADRK